MSAGRPEERGWHWNRNEAQRQELSGGACLVTDHLASVRREFLTEAGQVHHETRAPLHLIVRPNPNQGICPPFVPKSLCVSLKINFLSAKRFQKCQADLNCII